MDGESKVSKVAIGQFARLSNRHCRRYGGLGIENRKPERSAGIVRDQHPDKVLIGIAEVEKWNVQSSSDLIHYRIRERYTILRICRIRIRWRRKNCLRSPGDSSVGRTAKAQLARTVHLKACPCDVDIVSALDSRIRTHCKPFFVAAVI